MIKRLLTTLLILLSFQLYSQNFSELIKLVADDREADDRFGYDVAIDGDYAVVGAYGDDFSGVDPNMGSAYVFKRTGYSEWTQVQKLIASDQGDYDRFGFSVAIHGDYIVIGSYQQDTDESGSNNVNNAGAAYIYKIDGTGLWNEVQKIVASDRSADDEFGFTVAIHDSTIAVGAHADFEDENGLNPIHHAGSVYLFDLGTGGVWQETQKIAASDRAPDINYPNGYSGEDLSDQFGHAIDIWNDYLIVGALHHDYDSTQTMSGPLWSSGAAYVFERDGTGTWNEVKKLQNFDREAWDRFGCAVSVDSTTIVVGAYSEDEVEDGVSNPLTNPGSAYIFVRDGTGEWNIVQKIVPGDRDSGDHFGYDIDQDGDYMILGCHSDNHDAQDMNEIDNTGSAYIFMRDGTGFWSEHTKIDAHDRAMDDEFGISTAISGQFCITGAFQQDYDTSGTNMLGDAGAAYIHTNDICVYPPELTQNVNLCYGDSVNVGSNYYSAAGTYEDTLIAMSGCDSLVTTNLTVDPEITNEQFIDVCSGDSIVVGGTVYNSSGTYIDVLSAINGCDSTVTTHLNVFPDNSSTQTLTICHGDSVLVGSTYYASTGVYNDTFPDINGCDSIVTTDLTVNGPATVSVIQNNNELTAQAGFSSYQWLDCDNNFAPLSGETNNFLEAASLGSYAVEVVNNGCSDTSDCYLVEGINSISEPQSVHLNLFPNPSGDGNFQMSIENCIPQLLEIYNHEGKLVDQRPISAKNRIVYNGNLVPGLYYIRITDSDRISRILKFAVVK